MTAFRNNLQKNDRVFDTVSNRQGKVAWTPRDSGSRRTALVYDGQTAPQYRDVMQLRLITNGRTPEDVPPVDGTPPALEPEHTAARIEPQPDGMSALDALKSERASNAQEMTRIEARFRLLKNSNERLDRAIAVMTDENAA